MTFMTGQSPTRQLSLRGAVRKIALSSLRVLALVAGGAVLWQHRRYLRVRRAAVQDHQRIFHSPGAFHVLAFLATTPGADVVEEVRALRRATRGSQAAWIYAGKAVVAAEHSAQIGEKDWSAIVLLQYPSRTAYDLHVRSDEMRAALGGFTEVYLHGFRRRPVANAMIPQVLLAIRAGQIVGGRASHLPFKRAESQNVLPQAEALARRLGQETEFGADAVVVVNLLKHGTREQRAAFRRYSAPMFGAMAEGGYGPVHVGRAVRIERDYDFDLVALVYYPGVEFFVDMAQSDFMKDIYAGKQLGDTQAVVTVPILDRL